MYLNSTIPLAIAAAFLAEVIMYLILAVLLAKFSNSYSACEFRLQFCIAGITNLGTKSVCSLVTKHSNGLAIRIWIILVPIRLKKTKKKGFGPFSCKVFVPI